MTDGGEASDLVRLIVMCSRAQVTTMMDRLRARGFAEVNASFALVMPLLDVRGIRSMVLAQRAGVTKQAMSQMVRVLEGLGYVEQIADGTDARAKLVRLTKRGARLKTRCGEIRAELDREATEFLGAEARGQVAAGLRRLLERDGLVRGE